MSQQKKRSHGSAPIVGAKRSTGGGRGREGDDVDDSAMVTEEENGLVFEDPYGDEFDDESMEDNEIEEVEDFEGEEGGDAGMEESNPAVESVPDEVQAQKQVWRPGIDKLPEGEELEYDPSAYIMYHSMRTEWPCLSFDIIRDNLGDNRLRVSIIMYHTS